MSERKLVKKLANVMKEVKYIQKKGYNQFNRYKYATEADVNERVREVLADQQVILLPDVVEHETREHTNRKGYTEYITKVVVKFTFYDGETGETLSIHAPGEGQDAGDKGVYKAMTGAQKYALMKCFMIPTGDDPEQDSRIDERNTNGPETTPQSNPQPQQKQEEQPMNDVKTFNKMRGLWELHAGDLTGFPEWYKPRKDAGMNDKEILDDLKKQLSKREQKAQ